MLFIKLASYDGTTAEISIAHFSDLLCLSLLYFMTRCCWYFANLEYWNCYWSYFYSSYRSHASKIFPSSLSGFVHQTVCRFCLIIFLHLFHHLQYWRQHFFGQLYLSVFEIPLPRENYFLFIKPSAIRSRVHENQLPAKISKLK